MINLAGVKEADKHIKDELTRAGIYIIKTEFSKKNEVPYTLKGKLGNASFHRAWHYWVVNCKLPLHIAKELYAHPEGKKSIRVSGHCGCPPPEDPWIDWIDENGYKLGRLNEWNDYPDDSMLWDSVDKETMISKSGEFKWVESPEAEGTPYITLYHIDSQAGLLLFAEAIKRHG